MSLFLNEIGIVNALGTGKADVLARLLDGGAGSMTPHTGLLSGRSTWVGPVPGDFPPLPDGFQELDCRNNRVLAAALDQIAPALAELRQRVGPDRIAVVIGTSTSGIAEGEKAVEVRTAEGRWPEAFHYRQQEIGTVALFAARYLGLTGPRYTVSVACSSSAKVFASARRLFASGRCDAAVVGGCDTLCNLTLNGFDALESLSPDVCNPFSVNRNGINIGEGACAFVISREPSEIELLGVGESSDGHHISAPDPSGRGAAIAMRAALSEAGLKPGEIGYINLHGTATPQNDAMESRALADVFGTGTICSSTKSQIGHTLGAAGAQEVGLCWLLLDDANDGRRLPEQIWDGQPDPELPELNLAAAGATWQEPIFMSNSFAFGGSNASVIVGRRA